MIRWGAKDLPVTRKREPDVSRSHDDVKSKTDYGVTDRMPIQESVLYIQEQTRAFLSWYYHAIG